eukprot:UN02420
MMIDLGMMRCYPPYENFRTERQKIGTARYKSPECYYNQNHIQLLRLIRVIMTQERMTCTL